MSEDQPREMLLEASALAVVWIMNTLQTSGTHRVCIPSLWPQQTLLVHHQTFTLRRFGQWPVSLSKMLYNPGNIS